MIPPELPPPPAPLAEAPAGEQTLLLRPPWGYQDLFVFLGLLTAGVLAVNLLAIPFRRLPQSYLLLLVQALVYLFALGAIAAILRLRHDRPFWRSLGWVPTYAGYALTSFAIGPVLAIGLGVLGTLLGAKPQPLPFENMLNGIALIVLFGILVVAVGPLCEELVFRGFLMPLLIRSLGVASGIVLTGLLFGAMHYFEYQDWRVVILVAAAGALFGWQRYRTGSIINAVLMHAGFNFIQFGALLAAQRAHLR